jgi:hypothetical protein
VHKPYITNYIELYLLQGKRYTSAISLIMVHAVLPDGERPALVYGYLDHDTRVTEVCNAVRAHYEYTRSRKVPHNIVGPYNSPGDIPYLDRILRINRGKNTAEVEANVTMESLVDATLQLGLVPCVVACQRNTTVAEAFANITNESSSFAFGTFDCTVIEIEVILGNGSVVWAGPNANEELFYGSAGTMNSLGLTTMFEVSLRSQGPYVELEFLSPLLSNMHKELTLPRMKDLFTPQQSPKELSFLSMATQEAIQAKKRTLADMEQQSSVLHRVISELQNIQAEIQKPTSLRDMVIEKVHTAKGQQPSPLFYTAVVGTIEDTKRAMAGVEQSLSLLSAAMNHTRRAIVELRKHSTQLHQTAKLNQGASDESLEDTSLLSMAMANMLWASSDSSAEFVEAMMFKDYAGVVIGRTCSTYSGLFFEPSVGESYTEFAESVMSHQSKDKRSQVRYMKTASYLFRNDTARPGEKLRSEKRPATNSPIFQIAVCSDAIEDLLEEFQPEWNAWPLRICPVLSPASIGYKPSHGIGSGFDFPKDLYFALGSPHIIETGRIDRMLGQIDLECQKKGAKMHPKGFRFLHCHLRGYCLVPWSAHDHKSHRNLREKWHAVFPDVLAQLEEKFEYKVQ